MLEFIRGLFKAEEKKSEPVKVAGNSETEKYFHLWMSYFVDAYTDFVEGDEKKLPTVYSYLASGDIKVTVKAADAIARYMEKLDYVGICHLDDWFRQLTSMEWSIDWKGISPKDIRTKTRKDYLWVLRLGTFHPNGYFREKCVKELQYDKGSLIFIILRLNDWVPEVRRVASKACLEIPAIQYSEVIPCLLYLEKLRQRGLPNDAVIRDLEDKISDTAQNQTTLIDRTFVRTHGEIERRVAYRFFVSRKLVNKAETDNIISWEKNSQLQALLMTLLIQNYEVSTEELDTYINHKSLSVNYKALEVKYERIKDYWAGLENSLLSRSTRIRSYVSHILNQHTSIDIAAYYRERLETSNKKVCILGLGDNGTKEDVETLKPYLEASEEGIVKATLHAIGSLLREDGAEIYWRFLQDSREVVARQAYREIAAHDVRYGAEKIFNLLTETESELLKEKLTLMLLKEPVWDALPYRLMLYASEDEAIKSIIHPFKGRISTYSTMSAEHAEWIKSIMADEKYKIPKGLQDEILFSMKYSIK